MPDGPVDRLKVSVEPKNCSSIDEEKLRGCQLLTYPSREWLIAYSPTPWALKDLRLERGWRMECGTRKI